MSDIDVNLGASAGWTGYGSTMGAVPFGLGGHDVWIGLEQRLNQNPSARVSIYSNFAFRQVDGLSRELVFSTENTFASFGSRVSLFNDWLILGGSLAGGYGKLETSRIIKKDGVDQIADPTPPRHNTASFQMMATAGSKFKINPSMFVTPQLSVSFEKSFLGDIDYSLFAMMLGLQITVLLKTRSEECE